MSSLSGVVEAPGQQLWKEIEKVRAGMLGLVGSANHPQPMAPNGDEDGSRIWFLTRKDTDLFQELGAGKRARFTFVSSAETFHASIVGPLRENRDRRTIERYWNEVVAAWFDGIDDPMMTMLELQLDEAAIWASTGNALRFGWEIMKANDEGSHPDVGAHTILHFVA